METIRAVFYAALCLSFPASFGQETRMTIQQILSDEITEAAKLYFASNVRLDGSGFNTISEDEDWTATELFQQQYGEDASTASFVAGLMEFEYYQPKNVSFSDVTQLIIVGQHRDARQAFSAYVDSALTEIENLVGEDGKIEDVNTAKGLVRSAFISAYDVVGNVNFGSFLNLELGSSLSFVMDTTGSMSSDIAAAKARVVEIIERTRGTNSEPLKYLLVPFNDPVVGPSTETSDPVEFIDAISALSARGGGDEPEMAMGGTLRAAHLSSFRSIVYVFTDASAKDEYLRDNVIALCLTKKIGVFVFLTFDITTSMRQVYDDIAASTGGSVLYVPKSEITSASAIMEATTVQGLVTLIARSSNATSFTLNVDSTITSLLVQFIGTFNYLSFDGPDGTMFTSLASISSAELFRIDGVTAGAYTFKFDESQLNQYGILIRGKSGLGFHAKLQQRSPESGALTTSQQFFAGRTTKAEMTIYGDDEEATFERFQLMSRDGTVLIDMEVEKEGEKFYATVEEFILPERPSVVRMIGTHNGMPLVRIDPCAITPTVSAAVLNPIDDLTVKAGETIQVSTTLKNIGAFEAFSVVVSDNQEYVTLSGASSSSGFGFSLNTNDLETITLTITVPAGTQAGVLSKVILSATANNGGYFIFTNFVVSVIDDVIRCPSPTSPIGGRLFCNPDARSIGSNCTVICGDEYILDGADVISCQADGTWSPNYPGTCQFLGSQTCTMSGDPHYTTFDGLRYDFQGSCLYTFVETLDDTNRESFTIQTENGLYYGSTHVSWFKQVFITVYNTSIQLKLGQIVLVDGVAVTLPNYANGGRLQILYDGGDVLVKTDFKLEARLNSRHNFRVSLPATYRNAVHGLCGNYDGEMVNEFQMNNTTFTVPSEFGNSLEIVGGSEPWCRKGTPEDDESGCNEAQIALHKEKCAPLKSTDCFRGCADNATVDSLFDACVFDMCALGGSDAISEGHISDFANYCVERGSDVCNWREEFGYPTPTCGQNEHYEFRGNRCPNTCVDPKASRRCTSKPKVEGCFCNQGFVLDGTSCVRLSECGCADAGAYYQNGFTFVKQGCNEQCVCSDGSLTCSPLACEEGKVCGIVPGGQYGCIAERIDQCSAVGDPHYKTLDGSRFDFMGTCRYVMLTTNGSALADANRHVTITAQNEHRNGLTSVSYVRSVTVQLPGNIQAELGPGDTYSVTVPMNSSADAITIERAGQRTIASTKYGVTVKFDGTNLFIDVPNYYMNKVSGLCGNYTGSSEDDFGGMSLEDFAVANRYADGCNVDDTLPAPFVCSPEDTAKWSGPEFCGKMNDTAGPFFFCLSFVDIGSLMENCIFDACATEGEAIDSALKVLAEECKDHVPCDWEVQLGIAKDCPMNSEYVCDSTCQNTCKNPRASTTCKSTEEVAQCVCQPGYILNEIGGDCVKASSCGCVLEDNTYVEQGYTEMAKDCQFSISCTGPGSTEVVNEPCTEETSCLMVEEGEYECVPNELAHTMVFGGIHFKTFDDYYFDFRGNCAYLLIAHDSSSPASLSFRVYIVNRETSDGRIEIDQVIMEGWREVSGKFVIRVGRDMIFTMNGIRYPVGAQIDQIKVNRIRGNLALEFDLGVQIHYNGKDWVRVDVPQSLMKTMYGMGGNYNHDKNDDLLVDGLMLPAQRWGDSWVQEDRSPAMCSKTSPPTEIGCLLRPRYQRSCDCGVIRDDDGPFAACHVFIDPEPYMNACVTDACDTGGSTMAMIGIMKAYRLACLGKGVLIRFKAFTEIAYEEASCPENSHFSECTGQTQPTCASPEPNYRTKGCEEGCVCDDGFIMSNDKCIPVENCGCISDRGVYFEHGVCNTNDNCTKTCTCVYGSWNCEDMKCNDAQTCSVVDGVKGCHWKDPCTYNNGGCSDMCDHNDDYEALCSCKSRRILTKDSKTCIEISPTFFEEDVLPDSCGVAFSAWKSQYKNWQDVYVPRWQKELKEYEDYVKKGIISTGIDVCQYSWTEWYDRDDPSGCGDDESLEMIRSEHPEICENPISAQVQLADGRGHMAVSAKFEVTKRGVTCTNAEQERGVVCPDLAVRFLCRVPVVIDQQTCK